ncbi:Cytochrome P450 3A41 [Trichoplax sp. H2]|nr:Cytochrome P450 3A41 [Trichoplax sp. H2]|eukprot:RDD37349.1 Cytochrome P450 3A41 [Trichoplax sp. H2]
MVQKVLITQSKKFINRISLSSANRKSIGLFQACDEVWKRARDSLSPLFSSMNLNEMIAFTNKADFNTAISMALPTLMKYVEFLINHRRISAIINATRALRQIVADRRNEMPQIGGYDTTASTLTFISYLLATHLQVQDRAIAEIDEKCPSDRSLTYESANSLTYISMIINETIGLFSPGYINLREAKEDFEINGVQIAKGIGLAVAVKAIQSDPELWPRSRKIHSRKIFI